MNEKSTELEYSDAEDDAKAIVIYMNRDEGGNDILQEGTVIILNTPKSHYVITGKASGQSGVWLYTLPTSQNFVYGAHVKYIRKIRPPPSLSLLKK